MHKRKFSENSSQCVIELRSDVNKCDWIIKKDQYDQEGSVKTLSKQGSSVSPPPPRKNITILGEEKENAKLGSLGLRIVFEFLPRRKGQSAFSVKSEQNAQKTFKERRYSKETEADTNNTNRNSVT